MTENSRAFYTKQDGLAFRHYVLRHMKLPMADLEPEPAAFGSDVLALSLASFRDLITGAFACKRADGETFRVFPAYVDCTGPDAFAARDRGVHLCGLYAGLAAACFEFSLFCFSQERFFPGIGESSREISPDPIDGFPPGFWMHNPGAGMNESDFIAQAKKLIPKSEQRYVAALLMTCLMMRFVWLHEFYHCINGHIGLVKARKWAFFLHEIGIDNAQSKAPFELQCLELDADQSAFYQHCQIQLAGRENIEGIKALPPETRLQFSIFAAYATSWMIEEYARGKPRQDAAGHPEPYVRLYNLVRTLAGNILPQAPAVKDIHAGLWEQVACLHACLPSFPSLNRIVGDKDNAELQTGLDNYQAGITRLRAGLAPYRYQ